MVQSLPTKSKVSAAKNSAATCNGPGQGLAPEVLEPVEHGTTLPSGRAVLPLPQQHHVIPNPARLQRLRQADGWERAGGG
jgi:hypothetical protein